MQSATPEVFLLPVWPLPRSLATTCGISVDFFSSPYLDVSVQAVSHVRLFDSTHADGGLLRRVPPFGNLRVNGYLLLTAAFRSLSRPSSAPSAKASALCSFLLDQLLLVFFSICCVALSRCGAQVPSYIPLLAPSAPCIWRKILRNHPA